MNNMVVVARCMKAVLPILMTSDLTACERNTASIVNERFCSIPLCPLAESSQRATVHVVI